MLGVGFTEIKGGFSCTHVLSFVEEDSHLLGGRHSGQSEPRVADDEIRFEIVIVKVPIVSLHGVQFKRIGGNTWQYKAMAEQIVEDLRL